jgi:hypothetical protein
MLWSDQLTRIRRWVRDPDGAIFTDAFLLRLFNDELQQLYGLLGPVADVQVVRAHPSFQMGYQHDFEWAYSGHADGEVYQVGEYYDPDDYVYLHIWEPEHLKGYPSATTAVGEVYTQPWEAWMVTTPHFPPPIPLPEDFESVLMMTFDRDEITPLSKREVMRSDDTTWKTRTGTVASYWRDEKNSNWIYLYPLPPMTWQDDYDSVTIPQESEDGVAVVSTLTFGTEELTFGDEGLEF